MCLDRFVEFDNCRIGNADVVNISKLHLNPPVQVVTIIYAALWRFGSIVMHSTFGDLFKKVQDTTLCLRSRAGLALFVIRITCESVDERFRLTNDHGQRTIMANE